MGRVIFITGSTRSGKSKLAVDIALMYGGLVVFVATYRLGYMDIDMLRRVYLHRLGRPRNWLVLESPANFVDSLYGLDRSCFLVLIDCLSLWLSDRIDADDTLILDTWKKHILKLSKSPWPIVIVSSEINWGVVPDNMELRRFCDLLGWINQCTATQADEVWLCVSGCHTRLK